MAKLSQKALLFKDPQEFEDFVVLHGPSFSTRSGYTLFHGAPPGVVDRTVLVLSGFVSKRSSFWSRLLPDPLKSYRATITHRSDQLTVEIPGEPAPLLLKLSERAEALHLLDLIAPKPWPGEPDELPPLLFWLESTAIMQDLVRDSFRLENDRIRYATLKRDGQSRILLRIERPSYFLLQWCLEYAVGQLTIFYACTPRLYVQWGYCHPLAEMWSALESDGPLSLVRASSQRQTLNRLNWRDIYRITDVACDLPQTQPWSGESAGDPPRLQLTMRMEKRARPRDPELWLIPETQQPQLERLLSLIDQDDLDQLLISVQATPDNKRLFVIREKRLGEGRAYLDFGGSGYTSYKGFHNLMLAVGWELQPQLRRDQYRDLFGLRPGQLTIVSVSESERAPAITLLTLPENSFKPLTRFIDYLIAADSVALESLMARSVFDFAGYAAAPSRPDLRAPKPYAGSARPVSVDKPEGQPQTAEATQAEQEQRHKPKSTPQKAAPQLRSRLEQREFQIEQRLIGNQPPTAVAWSELVEVKLDLGKLEQAATAAIEAWWLADEFNSPSLRELTSEILDRHLQINAPASRAEQIEAAGSPVRSAIPLIAFCLHGADASGHELNRWLKRALGYLREGEQKLRKKTRWLVWGQLLRHNHDVREAARVKEELINELNTVGLTPLDVPGFIQQRIFAARNQSDGERQGAEGLNRASENLFTIHDYLLRVEAVALRQAGLMVLAHSYARFGSPERAQQLIRQPRSGNTLPAVARAWIHLYASHAETLLPGEHTMQHADRLGRALEQLEPEQRHKLAIQQESLQIRDEIDDLSRFLSQDNRDRLFPTRAEGSALFQEQLGQLRAAFEVGDLERAAGMVESVLKLADQQLNEEEPDLVEISRLLTQTVEVLGKLKWGSAGTGLVWRFQEFVKNLPAQLDERRDLVDSMYLTLLRINLADGLLSLGDTTQAVALLNRSLRHFIFESRPMPLDFIDICSTALDVIEAAPLNQRETVLAMVSQGLMDQTHPGRGDSFQYSMPAVLLLALQLVDHLVEVATSKDKLTLGLLKLYMDRDEMLIRERIIVDPLVP